MIIIKTKQQTILKTKGINKQKKNMITTCIQNDVKMIESRCSGSKRNERKRKKSLKKQKKIKRIFKRLLVIVRNSFIKDLSINNKSN